MFKDNFTKLCNEKNEAPSNVCKNIGLSASTYSYWTDVSIPHKRTLLKIADYFGVTVEDLLSEDEKKPVHLDGSDDTFDLSEHEIKLVQAYRTSEHRNKVIRILNLEDKLKTPLDLTIDEKKVILAYRDTPKQQAIIDKLLDVPNEERGILVYTAACSEDNRPDEYTYIDRDTWKRIMEAHNSDNPLI